MLPIKFYIQKMISGTQNKIRLYADVPWQRTVELFVNSSITEIELGYLTEEEAMYFAEYLEGTAHEIRTMITENK